MVHGSQCCHLQRDAAQFFSSISSLPVAAGLAVRCRSSTSRCAGVGMQATGTGNGSNLLYSLPVGNLPSIPSASRRIIGSRVRACVGVLVSVVEGVK